MFEQFPDETPISIEEFTDILRSTERMRYLDQIKQARHDAEQDREETEQLAVKVIGVLRTAGSTPEEIARNLDLPLTYVDHVLFRQAEAI